MYINHSKCCTALASKCCHYSETNPFLALIFNLPACQPTLTSCRLQSHNKLSLSLYCVSNFGCLN